MSASSIETDVSDPIMLSASTMKKKLRIRVPGCKWSKSFSIDAVGTVETISCQTGSRSAGSKHRVSAFSSVSSKLYSWDVD